MNRTVLGALGALLLVAAGTFWYQGHAAVEPTLPLPQRTDPEEIDPEDIPTADVEGLAGPDLPEASEATREERRFNRFDKDRDNLISRNELMASRTDAFRKLDSNHNNLLTFEEWAVATGNRFRAADRDGSQYLTRGEFTTTRPKPAKPQKCGC